MARTLLAAVMLGALLLSSGCGALVLLGVGGTAGYMIKKGEDSGGGKGSGKASGSKASATGGAPKAATSSAGTPRTSTTD